MSAEKIKILELRTVSGTGGGPEKTIFLTAKSLDPSRFKTRILYTRNRRDPDFNRMKQHYELPPSVGYEEYVEKHAYDLGLLKRVYRICADEQIDIVHSHEYKTDVVCGLLRKKMPAKWVSTFHAAAFANLKLKLYQTWAFRELKKADRVFVVSPHQERLLRRHGVPGIAYLPNGVDTDTYRPGSGRDEIRRRWGISPNDVVAGFVGRLAPEKNLFLLLEAFRSALTAGGRAFLFLAGEGPERGALERFIREKNLEDRVRLLGFVENTVPFYAGLDLYAQSSSTEGMPNTILEAMASGLPVVATGVGGVGELVENGKEGFLVPAGGRDAFGRSMLKLMEEPRLRREMGNRGREKAVSRFSFKERVRRLEGEYERLRQK